MKNFLLTFPLLLLTQFCLIANQVKAQADPDAEIDPELFEFCSKSPQNSKCEGFTPPVSLEDRPGEDAQCFINDQEEGDSCKILLEEETLTFYIETGEDLEVLDDDKDTKEVAIPLTAIESFSYAEDSKVTTGRALTLGIFSLLNKKETSAFEFMLEPSEDETIPNQAFFVIERDEGEEFLQEIEAKTQLSAEIIEDSE